MDTSTTDFNGINSDIHDLSMPKTPIYAFYEMAYTVISIGLRANVSFDRSSIYADEVVDGR
jgi:hypothetical protein